MQNARQLTEISRITTFNLKNDTALLLGTLIFLLGYTDYDLDYNRQRIINDLQQQNRNDFVIGLQKWAPSVQNNKSDGPNLQTLLS